MANTKLTVGRSDPYRNVLVRVPLEMHACIKSEARNTGRSINAEILHRLAQTLGEDFAAEQPEAQPVLAEMLDCLRELVDLARETAARRDHLPI